jgi:hypothetical protein
LSVVVRGLYAEEQQDILRYVKVIADLPRYFIGGLFDEPALELTDIGGRQADVLTQRPGAHSEAAALLLHESAKLLFVH